MNFLAHTLLSCHNEDMLIGNFMADFLTKNEAEAVKPSLRQGIEVHKIIDNFTDSHPSVLEAIKILRPTQKKYSPVVVDILLDYILTQKWSQYSHEPLKEFSQRVYIILAKHIDDYPPVLQEKIPRMINDDFLYSCENIERLIRTFSMVAKRAKFENHFDQAHIDLIQHEEALTACFDTFFPDLVQHVKAYCDCE